MRYKNFIAPFPFLLPLSTSLPIYPFPHLRTEASRVLLQENIRGAHRLHFRALFTENDDSETISLPLELDWGKFVLIARKTEQKYSLFYQN